MEQTEVKENCINFSCSGSDVMRLFICPLQCCNIVLILLELDEFAFEPWDSRAVKASVTTCKLFHLCWVEPSLCTGRRPGLESTSVVNSPLSNLGPFLQPSCMSFMIPERMGRGGRESELRTERDRVLLSKHSTSELYSQFF